MPHLLNGPRRTHRAGDLRDREASIAVATCRRRCLSRVEQPPHDRDEAETPWGCTTAEDVRAYLPDAGDAFAAGYVAGMLSGATQQERLVSGHRRAHLVLQSTSDLH